MKTHQRIVENANDEKTKVKYDPLTSQLLVISLSPDRKLTSYTENLRNEDRELFIHAMQSMIDKLATKGKTKRNAKIGALRTVK